MFETDTFDILEHVIPRDESMKQILGATNNGQQASSSAGTKFIATMLSITSVVDQQPRPIMPLVSAMAKDPETLYACQFLRLITSRVQSSSRLKLRNSPTSLTTRSQRKTDWIVGSNSFLHKFCLIVVDKVFFMLIRTLVYGSTFNLFLLFLILFLLFDASHSAIMFAYITFFIITKPFALSGGLAKLPIPEEVEKRFVWRHPYLLELQRRFHKK